MKKQNVIIVSAIIGLIVVVVAFVFLFNTSKTIDQNDRERFLYRLIQAKSDSLSKRFSLIEEKQKKDSMAVIKKIQEKDAILKAFANYKIDSVATVNNAPYWFFVKFLEHYIVFANTGDQLIIKTYLINGQQYFREYILGCEIFDPSVGIGKDVFEEYMERVTDISSAVEYSDSGLFAITVSDGDFQSAIDVLMQIAAICR